VAQIQARERVQEAIGDDHVYARLCRVVHAPAKPHGDRRIEVGHLDGHVQVRLRTVLAGVAANLDLQVAASVAAALGDEHPARDAPAHQAVQAIHLVFGCLEGQQLHGPA